MAIIYTYPVKLKPVKEDLIKITNPNQFNEEDNTN